MTSKEKAEDLFNKMLHEIEWNAQPSTVKGVAKQCALIAVDEVFSVITVVPYGITYLSLVDYWQEVKEEIEKI